MVSDVDIALAARDLSAHLGEARRSNPGWLDSTTDCIRTRHGCLLLTVSTSDTVKGMTMTIATPTIKLDVDRDLIEHRKHLPETISCRCGYRRVDTVREAPARTLGE